MERKTEYEVVIVTKDATVERCLTCGAVVLHKVTHDAWHALIDAHLTELWRVMP
jgi:hypothetical protein